VRAAGVRAAVGQQQRSRLPQPVWGSLRQGSLAKGHGFSEREVPRPQPQKRHTAGQCGHLLLRPWARRCQAFEWAAFAFVVFVLVA
jgi:hypothetical protein